MPGILHHLLLSLRLNFRSRQALIYGYLVPVFFLFAFGSVFHSSVPPLLNEMGQLITITVLGGACFGMPTTMVSERERGVWRRYRLLPAPTAGFIISTMASRYVIIILAVLLQFGLAWCLYRTPLPAHPVDAMAAFTMVCFAFLGMGLVIAMLAETVPAVQALGQAIFLPMIMIGGVGVPLRTLPSWARHAAGYLPGRYAVEALDACVLRSGHGLAGCRFALAALFIIGLSACISGACMFRWDAGQRLAPGAKAWIFAALAGWAAVGLTAEMTGRLATPLDAAAPQAPAAALATTAFSSPSPLPTAAPLEPWQRVTPAEIDAVPFENLPKDDGVVTPLAANLDDLSADEQTRVANILQRIQKWPPGLDGTLDQRLRNLLSAASVADILQDPQEGAVAYVIFDYIRQQVPDDDLKRALTYVITHPAGGAVRTKIPELGIEGEASEDVVRDRTTIYAQKLLREVLGK